MKINGRLIFALPIGSIDTSIGKLVIFSLSMGNMESLMESADGSLESYSPDDFVKQLILYTCYKEADLNENKERPDSQSLSRDDINRLSDEEIESIATKYIECSPSLTRGDKITEDEEGNRVTHAGQGEVKWPREEDESWLHYLHRLHVIQEKEIKESNARLVESIIGSAKFSTGLSKDILKTISKGDVISKALHELKIDDITKLPISEIKGEIEGIHKESTDQAFRESFPTSTIPPIDYESIREGRLAPFKDLGNRLDHLVESNKTLIEISGNALDFVIDSNKVQSRIASEIKMSGEAASKIGTDSLNVARCGYKITKWVFVFAIISIALSFIGIGLSELGRWREDSDSEYLYQKAEQVITGLDNLSDAVNSDHKTSEKELKAILSQIDKNRISQSEHVRMMLDQQAKFFQLEIKRSRIQDQEKIKELEQKLSAVEARLEGKQSQSKPSEEVNKE